MFDFKKQTPAKMVTYLDISYNCYEYYVTTNPNGPRVVVRSNTEKGVEIRAIKGDGRTAKFKEFEKVMLPYGTPQPEIDRVASDLAHRYFE